MLVIPIETFEEGIGVLKQIATGDLDRKKCVLFLNEDRLPWGRCMNLANGFRGLLLSHEQIQISINEDKVRGQGLFLRFWNLCTENFCSFFPRGPEFKDSLVEITRIFAPEST
jgi:hypothetical protein